MKRSRTSKPKVNGYRLGNRARRHVLEHVPLDPLHKKIFLESEQRRTSNDIARENGVSPAAVRQIKHRISNLITTYCRNLVG